MVGAAGSGMLVVLNIATTVGQGTGGLFGVQLKAAPVAAGAIAATSCSGTKLAIGGRSPADAAESGLLCTKHEVDGVEIILTGTCTVKTQAGGRMETYDPL